MKRLPLLSALRCTALLLAACAARPQGEAPGVPEPPPAVQPQEPPEESAAPENEEIAALRAMARDADCLCAMTYLGYGTNIAGFLRETDEGKALREAWPFLTEIPPQQYVEYEGDEIYCVIPADPEAVISVHAVSIDDGGAVREGTQLYRGQHGQALLLRGNVSDIVPNVSVTVSEPDGGSCTFQPALSLKDGSLGVSEGDGVLDFTIRYPGRGYRAPEGSFVGVWEARAQDGAGAAYDCTLTFFRDGTMVCGIAQDGVQWEELTGSYLVSRSDGNVVRMDLTRTGGQRLADGAPPYALLGEFMLVEEDQTLYVTHLYGAALLDDTENETIVFHAAKLG